LLMFRKWISRFGLMINVPDAISAKKYALLKISVYRIANLPGIIIASSVSLVCSGARKKQYNMVKILQKRNAIIIRKLS